MTPTPSLTLNRLSAAWLLFAMLTLGASALYAIVLVVARTPFLGQGAQLFRTALVLHVDLAILVWFLAVAAVSWTLTLRHVAKWQWALFALAVAGTLLMIATPLIDDAHPLLTNYIPLIDHPFYIGGLVVFALVTAFFSLHALPRLKLLRSEPEQAGSALAALALLVSLGLIAQAFLLPRASQIGIASLDDLLWSGGHTLQFVHILLMMALWCVLGQDARRQVTDAAPAMPLTFLLAFLPVLAAVILALAYPAGTIEGRRYFTLLMRWGTWPGPVLLGAILTVGLFRQHRLRPLLPMEKGLAMSLGLFALGCLLGAVIHGDTVAVPAHYHATVGSVTLAYIVWLLKLASGFALPPHTIERLQRIALLYGVGIAVLASSLGVAGYLGVPRKAAHVELANESAGYLSAMGVAGIGGLIGLTAVLMLVGGGLKAVLPRPNTARQRRDVRLASIALTIVAIGGLGWLLQQFVAAPPAGAFNPAKHAQEKLRADIKTRFDQGVIMLHAKQYEHALTAFHRVLQLAPEMPEAHVNMGFALIGLKRYKAAYDFFESATQLRRDQANAYYGMAVALEGMGDTAGALGAMQTYLHLSKADDPFRRKAEGALWEWREKLTTERSQPRKP